MAPRETENNVYAKFGVTNKEHYGMLWYFLEWSNYCKQTEMTVWGHISWNTKKLFALTTGK